MSRPRFLALLLAFITLAVYLPVGRFGFLNFDDGDYVTDNPFVKNGLTGAGVCWAFTTFHAGNWHPLTWLSHMTDCQLFALNPGAHHYVNALFHAANVALLLALIWRLTRELWPAVCIAALFAWHPLHVESVAWVSERKDVLSTFFALLSLLSYARFVQEKYRSGWWLALLFFALGLLAKPMLVTLPFILLLLDYWPLGRVAGCKLGVASSPASQLSTINHQPSAINHLILEKWPFFLLSAASCLVTFFAQKQGEAVISLAVVPLTYRLENAPVAAVNYLLKLFWPAGLCVYYPMPKELPALQVILSVAVLLLLSAAAWHWRKSRPYLLIGWLWFLGTLVPVIGLLQVGGQAMADRYAYIPSIGFFLALVFLARDLAVKIQLPKSIAAGLLVLVSTACILATESQLQYWRDSGTLFRRALLVCPPDAVSLINLGAALEEQGRWAEALDIYRQADAIDPGHYQLHDDLGDILSQLGRHPEALAEYLRGLTLRPRSGLLHLNAGIELATLNRFNEALTEFANAEKYDPSLSGPHLETGKVLFQLGRDSAGVDEFRLAVHLAPDNYQTLTTVAHYLAASENPAVRDGQNALPLALKANALSGQNQPVVFDVLGMVFAENGDFTNAIICAQSALDLATDAHFKRLDPIRVRLDLYRQHQPWRESFRATNAPAAN